MAVDPFPVPVLYNEMFIKVSNVGSLQTFTVLLVLEYIGRINRTLETRVFQAVQILILRVLLLHVDCHSRSILAKQEEYGGIQVLA